jgi:putative Holliday junction resolvase
MPDAAGRHAPGTGTVLAFDFGTRRVGVAVGEGEIRLAHPLATIAEEKVERRFAAIRALLEEWRPVLLLVGLPVHADGTAHELTARARRFARELELRFSLPVALFDERYTTREAGTALHAAGVSAREHKGVRDQVAAQLILQAYFEQSITA